MEQKPQRDKDYSWHLHRFYLLFFIFAICSILYYFGEIIDFFNWDFLRWSFFYGVHDVHRLVFLVPIIYAAYYFGIKATIVIIVLTICVFLPRAFLISPYPDPLLRASLFTVISAVVGLLAAIEFDSRKCLEKFIRRDKEQFLQVLENMEDGALIIGQDYIIRFMNTILKRELGEGKGCYCYEFLYKSGAPCKQICRISDVITGNTAESEFTSLSGNKYKVVSMPYMDAAGVACQLSIFRKIRDPVK